MLPGPARDHVLVLVHSVVSDGGVLSAAEHLVTGDAVVRLLRVVPRTSTFYQVLPPAPQRPDEPMPTLPLRIIATGDDMAATLLDLSRELRITLVALGEPSRERRKRGFVRQALSKLLRAGSTPVLYVPPEAREPRESLRRILVVVHSPYPALDLVEAAVPLARRSCAEVSILALPSAEPVFPRLPSRVSYPPFDAPAWVERECSQRGCRARLVAVRGGAAETIVDRAEALQADLVIAGAGLAELRVGFWRRRLLDLVFPRLSCPLLFSRCA
jgi:nucleotide-binding universal stress UspA family protein